VEGKRGSRVANPGSPKGGRGFKIGFFGTEIRKKDLRREVPANDLYPFGISKNHQYGSTTVHSINAV